MADSTSESNFLKDFRIPDYILDPQSAVEAVSYVPKCPVIVFINSKSGGQLGGDLLITYRSLLNAKQVCWTFYDVVLHVKDGNAGLRKVHENDKHLVCHGLALKLLFSGV